MNDPESTRKSRDPGIPAGIAGSAGNYSDNVIFQGSRGHGFAGESANHLADVLSGKKAVLVGKDFRLDGPDRVVNGFEIQTKYCRTGSECIAACFRDGRFRYMGSDGPMLIEVPSDTYEHAVQAMKRRIQSDQVPGVTDPEQAKAIVRKGQFTYTQVRNVAKFGTIESLSYDAVNGIQLAGSSMGVSAAVAFAVAIWNGEDKEVALRTSCVTGLQTGALAWVTSVLAAQMGRSCVEQGLRGTTDWTVQQLGPRVTSQLSSGLRTGSPIYGAAAANNLSKVLRGTIMTNIATTLVLSSADLVRLFRGRMSVAQVAKNLSTTAAGVAGGSLGWLVGSAVGANVGAAVPWIGPTVGRIVGGVSGAVLFATGASKAASTVLNRLIEDDAQKMTAILEKTFCELAHEYLLVEEEAGKVIERLRDTSNLPGRLQEMCASDDRPRFARSWLLPLVEQYAMERKRISIPSGDLLLAQIRSAGA